MNFQFWSLKLSLASYLCRWHPPPCLPQVFYVDLNISTEPGICSSFICHLSALLVYSFPVIIIILFYFSSKRVLGKGGGVLMSVLFWYIFSLVQKMKICKPVKKLFCSSFPRIQWPSVSSVPHFHASSFLFALLLYLFLFVLFVAPLPLSSLFAGVTASSFAMTAQGH